MSQKILTTTINLGQWMKTLNDMQLQTLIELYKGQCLHSLDPITFQQQFKSSLQEAANYRKNQRKWEMGAAQRKFEAISTMQDILSL